MLQAAMITTSMRKGTCVRTWLQSGSMAAIVCKLESGHLNQDISQVEPCVFCLLLGKFQFLFSSDNTVKMFNNKIRFANPHLDRNS